MLTKVWRHRMFRWAVVVLVLLGLVAGGMVMVRTHKTESAPTVVSVAAARNRAVGAGVAVTGARVPTDMKAAVVPGDPPLTHVEALTPLVEITPHGALPAPVTLRFKLRQRVTNAATVVVATREMPQGAWSARPFKVSTDGWYVEVETDHLSQWDVFQMAVAAFDELKKTFLNGLSADALAEATKPRCESEAAARQDGYQIDASAKQTLYWCFGFEGGKRVVHVVNRMSYPLNVVHPGFTVVRNGKVTLELSQLARIGFKNIMVLYPRDEAVLSLNDLAPGKTARLSTDFSGYANALYQLEFGLTAVVSITTRFGAGAGFIKNGAVVAGRYDQIIEVMDRLLGVKSCADAVLGLAEDDLLNFGKLVAECMSPARLANVFGNWQGAIMAVAMAAGPFVAFGRSQFSAFFGIVARAAQYVVVVSRESPFDRYVGKWYRHVTALTIRPDFTGRMYVGEGYVPDAATGQFAACNVNVDLGFKLQSDSSLEVLVLNSWMTQDPSSGVSRVVPVCNVPAASVYPVGKRMHWRLIGTSLIRDDTHPDYILDFCNDKTPSTQIDRC